MELGNGWSLATDKIRQRMELIVRSLKLPITNYQCPMPNPLCPILTQSNPTFSKKFPKATQELLQHLLIDSISLKPLARRATTK